LILIRQNFENNYPLNNLPYKSGEFKKQKFVSPLDADNTLSPALSSTKNLKIKKIWSLSEYIILKNPIIRF